MYGNDESGFVAAEKIKKRFPSIKIIIITSMLDYSYLDKARKQVQRASGSRM